MISGIRFPPRPNWPPEPETTITFEETSGVSAGFVVGVDLGKSKDFTAVVVLGGIEAERIEYRRTKFEPPPAKERNRKRLLRHRIVSMHRYPLATPYPDVCA